ncbi:MAG: thioredoxin domain-containing protein [Cyanobacteria bacterium P01_H01_bin.15]
MNTFRQQFRRLVLLIGMMLALQFGLINPSAHALGNIQGLAALRQLAQVSLPYETAIATTQPTVVEFYADWCEICQGMAPLMTQLHADYQTEIDFVMIDIDDPASRSLVQQYQALGVPQLTFLNDKAEFLGSLVGRVPESRLIEIFERLKA